MIMKLLHNYFVQKKNTTQIVPSVSLKE